MNIRGMACFSEEQSVILALNWEGDQVNIMASPGGNQKIFSRMIGNSPEVISVLVCM